MIIRVILVLIGIAVIGGGMSNSDVAYSIAFALALFSEPAPESITRLMNIGHFVFWGPVSLVIITIAVALFFKKLTW